MVRGGRGGVWWFVVGVVVRGGAWRCEAVECLRGFNLEHGFPSERFDWFVRARRLLKHLFIVCFHRRHRYNLVVLDLANYLRACLESATCSHTSVAFSWILRPHAPRLRFHPPLRNSLSFLRMPSFHTRAG